MINKNDEKLRAVNIIWNASADYSLQPEVQAYNESGKADLYWNYIIGAVHKYYDYSLLQSFFSILKEDKSYAFFENLTWIGLENCTYKKGKDERPALESLRLSYSERVLMSGDSASSIDILDKIRKAHFQRALGIDPKITGPELNLLNDLEFDKSISTEQIILKMNEIFKVYFEFIPSHHENVLQKLVKNRKMIHFGGNKKLHYYSSPFQKRFDIGSAELSGGINLEENKEKRNKITFHYLKFIEQRDSNQREYIQNYFGTSILPEPRTKALEQLLCSGNHEKCHLHFTRGEFDDNEDAVYQKNVALKQREKNKKHYKENFARNSNSISKLTNRIRNTMLVNLESSTKSKAGKLVSGKIWRNIYLHDDKVFIKSLQEDIGNLTVDIMLDASASQIYRQETIAAQGYIIAESLTRCKIPVKVYSFCNLRDYTVINLFRDYGEVNKNDNIFNYNFTGYNRDGLAIRTALNMMKDSPCENKILIVLSDGKPNDTQSISASGFNPLHNDYTGTLGVNDTALEVRKGRQHGISILGIFTGLEEDVPNAKRIYGRNFVSINSPERFADMVGVLIQNEIKNL